MDQKSDFLRKPIQKVKVYSIPGIFLVCFATIHSISLILAAVSTLAAILATLTLLTSIIIVPVLLIMIIVQVIINRLQKPYLINGLGSVFLSFLLVAGSWLIDPYISPSLASYKTDLQIGRYQKVVDKIHRGDNKDDIAYSAGGKKGHEDVAFLQYAIRFGASEFIVYSEDENIETNLLLEYDYDQRTDVKIKENWYRIRIED